MRGNFAYSRAISRDLFFQDSWDDCATDIKQIETRKAANILQQIGHTKNDDLVLKVNKAAFEKP